MSRSSRVIIAVICFLAVAVCATSFADQAAEVERTNTERISNQMAGKLWRGCVNILTGWGEIPRQVGMSLTEKGIVALPNGLLNGVFMTVARVGVGAYEVVFFPWPVEGFGYDPILEPVYFWRN